MPAQPLFEPPSGSSYSPSQLVVIVCSTLSIYNALELIILIFTTFRRYRGLYFWSLLVASVGLLPYNVGFLLEFFTLAPDYAGVVVDVPGWVMVVTGQSMVLYSRLHLVLHNPRRLLRAVLWMIVVDGVVFHTGTTVVRFAAYYGGAQPAFRRAWDVIEKVQMTGFCLQEFVISGLYLYETTRLLRVMKRKNNTRRTVAELFVINVFIIALDVGLLVVEYLDLVVYEQTFKGVIYSVKLKLEFAILGKLVKIVRSGSHVLANVSQEGDTGGVDFVDMTVTRNCESPKGSGRGLDEEANDDDGVWEKDFRRYSVMAPSGAVTRIESEKEAVVSSQHLEDAAKGFDV